MTAMLGVAQKNIKQNKGTNFFQALYWKLSTDADFC
jgi:hypothetical protein